ncbi:MAG: BrnT family toxin [Lachnospiraceae bacterium]|nr:BrnT family toxin [Lachnospiraceae bacterium]
MFENHSEDTMFTLGNMLFEYNNEKNRINIEKHGISFKNAARVFFDYDRIELYDEENSRSEDRYDTIGNLSAGLPDNIIGNIGHGNTDDIIFVVYTEKLRKDVNGQSVEVTRLISARMATNFERGLYYGKY